MLLGHPLDLVEIGRRQDPRLTPESNQVPVVTEMLVAGPRPVAECIGKIQAKSASGQLEVSCLFDHCDAPHYNL